MKVFKITLLLILVLFVGFILFILNETKDEVNANFNNIESIISELQVDQKNAGFAVSVFKSDSVLYQNGFGYADIKNRIPYTKDTEQYIASVSKTFIGVALLRAKELGLLNLDDPINMHLPFEVKNPYFSDDDITIRHLATHTSSLDYNEEVVESLYIKEDIKNPSLEAFNTSYFKEGRYGTVAFTDNKPGTQFNYSNIGAGLAAYIIENKSGLTFDKFTEKYIFQPLDMKNTSWFANKTDLSMHSKYYEPKGSSITEVQTNGVKLYPARDLISNIKDLTTYCQAIISRSSKLLQKDSFADLLSDQLDDSVTIHMVDNTGIFWQIDRNQYGVTYKLIGMNGGDNCINTMVWFDPKTELGYIFIGNTGPSEINRLNHIWIYRSLVSLGEHYLMNDDAISFKKKVKYKWHNIYSRINGLL